MRAFLAIAVAMMLITPQTMLADNEGVNASDKAEQGTASHLAFRTFGITKAQLESSEELQKVIQAQAGNIRGSKVDLLLRSDASFVSVNKVATVIQDMGVANITYWDKHADNSGYDVIVRCTPGSGGRPVEPSPNVGTPTKATLPQRLSSQDGDDSGTVFVTPTHTPKEIEITQERTAKLVTFTVQLSLAESKWVTAQVIADVLFEQQEVFGTAAQVDAPAFKVRFSLPVESAASATLRLGVSAKPKSLDGTSYIIRLADFRSQPALGIGGQETQPAPEANPGENSNLSQAQAVGEAARDAGPYPRTENALSLAEDGTSSSDNPLSLKELIARGSVLMNTNKDVAVTFVVRSVETVPTILADGSKLEVLHLVSNEDAAGNKFSAPMNPMCLAQLKQIGIDDIAKHFVGRTVTLRGRVTGTALQLYASPDVWTYHIDVRSRDDVLSVTTETPDDEIR